MIEKINKIGIVCTAWFLILTINAVIYTISELTAAGLYLLSLAGFVGWVIFRITLLLSKKEQTKK